MATSSADSLLQIRHLNKTYPNGHKALRDISFDVKKGEFVAIIGLSGSGKSTLLRCINRMHNSTSGEILFQDRDITKLEGRAVAELKTKIGMIFQQFNLVQRHSVLSNVLMGALARTGTIKSLLGFYKQDDQKKALEYLKLVGISEQVHARADQLSGGQQQRVAIARALIQKPELLLADEPVASLDPATCHVVMDYLKKVNQELGITVLCNLHFLSLVRQYATRVIALRDGEVVFIGDPSEITDAWFKKIYGEDAKEVHVS